MKTIQLKLITLIVLCFVINDFCLAQQSKYDNMINVLEHLPFNVPLKRKSFQKVSSRFGYRIHPLLNESRLHSGIDLAAPKGTPVIATAAGVVINSTYTRGYGNYIVIQHTASLKTLYAHLWINAVKKGDKIAQGQLIGLVGDTGMTTGPHLHYEIHINNKKIDPFIIWKQILNQHQIQKT